MTYKRKIIQDWSVMARAMSMDRAHSVFANGCFDILHAGHVELLQKARDLGSMLIVGVNSDASVRRLKGELRPVNSLHDRMCVLAALEMVDYVVSFKEDTPERLIQFLSPKILVKGEDWKDRRSEVAGVGHVEGTGGRVVFLPLVEGRSTTNVIRRITQ